MKREWAIKENNNDEFNLTYLHIKPQLTWLQVLNLFFQERGTIC